MTSSVSTGSDGWPKVRERLALRRFSPMYHLLGNVLALAIIIVAAVTAERTLNTQEPQGSGARTGPLSTFFIELGIPLSASEVTRAPAQATPSGKRVTVMGDSAAISVSILAAIGAIVIILIVEAFAHYQMKQAIHEHHADIDHLVVTERTKCRGDSKNETEASKARMTTLLETHEIRDYRDTWKLLNRQLGCAVASLGLVVLVLLLLSVPTPRDLILSAQLLGFALSKSIVAAIGLRGSENERRIHPWRDPKKPISTHN